MISGDDIEAMTDYDEVKSIDTKTHQILYDPSAGFRPHLYEIVSRNPLTYKFIKYLYPNLVAMMIADGSYWTLFHINDPKELEKYTNLGG